MKRINVLDKQISQLIAAGEVVERPASVVKELLENSIDAGAGAISVEIKHGGIKLIKITDNGSGIYREDVKNAFLRHATSKIKSANDLESIGSLGFRGEALASICAVSKVELITKCEDENIGTHFKIHGGDPENISDTGCASGTTLMIRDLFFNTPARMKFLKKDVDEANAIAGVMDKLALSHPEISFKFIREGKEVLHTPGDGKIASAIYSVYGKEFFSGMIPLEYEMGGIKATGFISKPEASKASRSMQNFFINGRYVVVKTASYALEEAFKNSVMVGKHPYCVIYITAPFGALDVNVHPAKTEVKFANEKTIFDVIYYGVKSALMQNNNMNCPLSIYTSPDKNLNRITASDVGSSAIFTKEQNLSAKEIPVAPKQLDFTNLVANAFKNEIKKEYRKPQDYFMPKPKFEVENVTEKITKIESTQEEAIEETASFLKESRSNFVNVIGEVFDCYIILQSEKDNLIFIDKHAAHERLIYEKLKENESKNESQLLLEPIIVNLEKNEYTAIIENLELLLKAGYSIDDFGQGSIILRSIPVYADLSETSNSIIEIANYILNNNKNIDTARLDWIYHNISCRAAIKAGKGSSHGEIVNLVKKLSENPDVAQCPHGRPIYVNIPKRYIEKQFGRV